MSAKDTSPPTLAEQIAAVRGWLDYETNESGSLVWEKEMRAILASLERLSTEQEFHNIDDVVKIRELESQLATLHSQIDGLMKRLTEAAMCARRYRALRDYGVPELCIVVNGIPSYIGSTGRNIDQVVDALADDWLDDSAMASQGGGDG